MKRTALSQIDLILISSVVALLTVYGFYFLAVPQHWSLIDHYSQVLNWGKPDFDPFLEWKKYLGSLMKIGRFRPIDIASWMIRFKFTPVSPRSFHLVQFGLLALALTPLFLLARKLKGFRSALISVLIAVSAFSIKDWIFITTAGDQLATCFLLWALYCYISEKKWAACVLYCLSFLTKESYFSFFLVFASLELADSKSVKFSARKLAPLTVMALAGAAFALYVRSLPQVYTASFGFENFGVKKALVALIFPAVKNYAPALLFLIFFSFRFGTGPWSDERKRLLAAGSSIVVFYSLFMVLWGPFDSWFYMHIPIPFGWAMIFSSVWNEEIGQERGIDSILVAICSVFFLGIALNGAKNFNDMAGEAKVVARISCEDSKRVRNLKIFTNCNEGSWQLRNYLLVDHVCENPPEFSYLNGAGSLPSGLTPPYEVVAMKQCDPLNLGPIPADFELPLSWWTIKKKF